MGFINMLLLPEHVQQVHYTTVELKRATAFLESDAFCSIFLSTVKLQRKKKLIALKISLLIKKGWKDAHKMSTHLIFIHIWTENICVI